MNDPISTFRNTKVRIPRGTIIRVLDTLENADKPSEPDGLGTFDAELLEDITLNVASSMLVRKKES